MSPKTNLLTAGLTALGLCGFVAPRVAIPAESPPSGQGPAKAPSASPTVLLLSNGRVLTGPISEDVSNYVIKQGTNDLRYPKRDVQGAFLSIEDAYRYKLAQVPDRDPDEQLKLARWCMGLKLMAEAKTALQAVLALSPNHAEASSMLAFSEGAEARAARRDPEVQRSGAEVAKDDEPKHLNPAVIRSGIRELGVSGQPVIFDLPAALAVKRANEFVRFVHPVLQRACARCHNEQYPGSFQLVQVKTRHDQTADVFRANLDATLRLVDPDDLAKSELLSSALVPHGPGPKKRPIFRGSNDPEYQILSAWVNNLRPPRSTDGVTPTGIAMPKPSSDDRFATNRANREIPGTPQPSSAPAPPASPVFEEAIPTPPGRMIPESATGAQPYAPANLEFPLSPLQGGPTLKLDSSRTSDASGAPAPSASGTPPVPGEALPALPGSTEEGAAGRKKKPVKLDPAILERMIRNRNAPR